jgi:putative ABC transport system ATP-binding protein
VSQAVAVRASGVVKRVRVGAATRAAVDGVDLQLDEGEYLLLLGRSGSGKTTLLSIVGGLTEADEGHVEVLGHDLSAMDERGRRALVRREIGWIFQTAGLLPSLTASENVAFALYLLGEEGPEVDRRVGEALEWVGLGARKKHRTDELSGGEQQRLALARALVKRPRLMLADEPTSQLDAETSLLVAQLVREVALSGTAVLVATHDPALREFADRVVEIEDGRVT